MYFSLPLAEHQRERFGSLQGNASPFPFSPIICSIRFCTVCPYHGPKELVRLLTSAILEFMSWGIEAIEHRPCASVRITSVVYVKYHTSAASSAGHRYVACVSQVRCELVSVIRFPGPSMRRREIYLDIINSLRGKGICIKDLCNSQQRSYFR